MDATSHYHSRDFNIFGIANKSEISFAMSQLDISRLNVNMGGGRTILYAHNDVFKVG